MKLRNVGEIRNNIRDSYEEKFQCQSETFVVPRDTNTFCRLVELAVKPGDSVVDLGCGDGIPTIHAAVQGAEFVVGIDIEEKAVATARSNACQLERYRDNICFFHADISDFLDGEASHHIVLKHCAFDLEHWDLVVSNPPYVPTDHGSERSIDGGPDGTKVISDLLERGAAFVGRLAWQQGSYTAPLKILKLARQYGWEIERLLMHAAQFGDFSNANYDHLEQLRKNGEAFFWTPSTTNNLSGPHWYLIMGFVVRSNPLDTLCDWQLISSALKEVLIGFQAEGPDYFATRELDFPFDVEVGHYPAD
jgi:methylase of polypeptide subunit release factors